MCIRDSAYADECDLGHQYAPVDLIAPVSTLTGTVPEMRPCLLYTSDISEDGLAQLDDVVRAIGNYDFSEDTVNGEQIEIIAALSLIHI